MLTLDDIKKLKGKAREEALEQYYEELQQQRIKDYRDYIRDTKRAAVHRHRLKR